MSPAEMKCTYGLDKGRVQVSRNGGNSPLWEPGGKELFYLNGNEVIAVLVETEPTFKVVRSETLFEGSYFNGDKVVGPLFDISPDGNRFIMSKQDETLLLIPREINVVLNWFEELKERVPVP